MQKLFFKLSETSLRRFRKLGKNPVHGLKASDVLHELRKRARQIASMPRSRKTRHDVEFTFAKGDRYFFYPRTRDTAARFHTRIHTRIAVRIKAVSRPECGGHQGVLRWDKPC